MIDLLKSWLACVGKGIAFVAGAVLILGLALLIGAWAWMNLPWLGALIVTVIVVGMVIGTGDWIMDRLV
jgi:hypothetical protein